MFWKLVPDDLHRSFKNITLICTVNYTNFSKRIFEKNIDKVCCDWCFNSLPPVIVC